jgi:uncharacterized protein (TIGR00369 family)
MNICTHNHIDKELCGTPVEQNDGFCKVKLVTSERMSVDHFQLVHGGFVFGLADHAAMLAVNDPNVVLGQASVTFIKPVQPNETLIAEANVNNVEGKKQNVHVKVFRNTEIVFEGNFVCFILKKHVLDS